jgi:thiamine pyrophosphokinase
MEKRRGVVFTGGEGPDPQIIRQILDGGAAETLLVAADSGLILAEAAGVRPDWVIGDMDSLGSILRGEDRLHSYPPERVIRHVADKDFTDTELALSLLWKNGCDEAWIIGGGGGRIAHLFGIRDLFEREKFPHRWITAAEDIYCIDGDAANNSLTIKLKQGGIVSVFSLGDGPWEAESKGLKWPLNKVKWERGLYGLSNVAAAEEIEIAAKQGRFMVILEEVWRQ